MGYHTEFRGAFTVNPPLTDAHRAYLTSFAQTRRMLRDPEKVASLPDPIRETVNLPVGPEGDYYVGGEGFRGQEHDASIIDYNKPPREQPGLWCQWVPSEDGTRIEWDGNEKFYDYVEWIAYLLTHFLKPWGYVVSGEVDWRGEDWDDTGSIVTDGQEVWIA